MSSSVQFNARNKPTTRTPTCLSRLWPNWRFNNVPSGTSEKYNKTSLAPQGAYEEKIRREKNKRRRRERRRRKRKKRRRELRMKSLAFYRILGSTVLLMFTLASKRLTQVLSSTSKSLGQRGLSTNATTKASARLMSIFSGCFSTKCTRNAARSFLSDTPLFQVERCEPHRSEKLFTVCPTYCAGQTLHVAT